jgi:predicted DCC family thiol-disulfide oxidoreductase YuxK
MMSHTSFMAYLGLSVLGLSLFYFARSPRFFDRYVGEATPGTLGAIRALACFILLTNAIWEDLASTSLLPPEARKSMGLMNVLYWIPGSDALMMNASALAALQWITIGFLFFAMIGWRTKFSLPFAACSYFVMAGILRQYSHFYHTGLVPLYLIAFLSFAPSADGWSVDRIVKVLRGRPVPASDTTAPIYGWGRYICWLIIALAYFTAALSKLTYGGVWWWDATNLRSILYHSSLDPMQFDWQLALHLEAAPDFVFAVFGLAALLGELLYPLVLVSPLARKVFPPLIFTMHVGIFFLQNILFFDLMLIQFVFADFRKIRHAVGKVLNAQRHTIQILYDGNCPLCLRTMRFFELFDLFERLRMLNFRTLDLTAFNLDHNLNLTMQGLDKEMYVIQGRKVYTGFESYRVIAFGLPALWLLLPLLYAPGLAPLGRVVYRYIARERLKILQCDSECSTDRSEPTVVSNQHAQGRVSYPIQTSIYTVGMLAVWLLHFEFYPFTAFPMFSERNTTGEFAYYKVLAHWDSGMTSRAYLEKAIGAMADTRYRDIIRTCFSSSKLHVCRKFLLVSGVAYNLRNPSQGKVTALEVQKWRWNFRLNPGDPNHGTLEDRVVQSMSDSPAIARSTTD